MNIQNLLLTIRDLTNFSLDCESKNKQLENEKNELLIKIEQYEQEEMKRDWRD